MLGPAFHISSKKTTSAVGKYPSVILTYLSSSFRAEMDTGPNISSGVLKRDIRYSKERPFRKADFSLLATMLFAVPGGPSRKILSPATAAKRDRESTCSFSKIPFPKTSNN